MWLFWARCLKIQWCYHCGGWNNGPQRCPHLNSHNCEYVTFCGKRGFTQRIKGLEMWRWFWLTQKGIKTRVLTRGRQESQRRRKRQEDKRRGWSDAAPQAKEYQWPPEAEKDKGMVHLWPPELQKTKSVLLEDAAFTVVICYSSHRKLIHTHQLLVFKLLNVLTDWTINGGRFQRKTYAAKLSNAWGWGISLKGLPTGGVRGLAICKAVF